MVEKCICGIDYENKNPVDHLKKVNINSSGNQIPCKTCIKTIVNNTTNDSITCFLCKKNFTRRYAVVDHILTRHVESAPYKCEFCDVKVKNMQNMKNHLLINHLDQSKEKCNYCNKVLRKEYLKQHIEIFHSDNPPVFLCPVCGAVFHTKRNYKDHLQLHEGKEYECSQCDKKCQSNRKLLCHRAQAHNKKPVLKKESLNCELCGKKISKTSLKAHMMNKHQSHKKYRCGYCEKILASKPSRDAHVKFSHNVGNVRCKCEIGGKSFRDQCQLKRHIIIHSGEKKFKCDTCGVSFNQKCTLTRHRVVHTGEKPFECGICGQRFTQGPYMKTHEKKHKDSGL